ncbi:MAG TPA: D-alanine--D-alanine ligase, partial [Cytophagaceae bacterium]
EEFPCKEYFLIEDLITKGKAKHFLEITGGLLTKYDSAGNIDYEIFEPSETLATGDVLSLEEKFLAGEGQNITPARFAKSAEENKYISQQVRDELKRVAKILNIEGYARIDAFVRVYDDNRAETIIIEINSLPGMTPATCIFHQTAINGYKPYDFIDQILTFGIKRGKQKLVK